MKQWMEEYGNAAAEAIGAIILIVLLMWLFFGEQGFGKIIIQYIWRAFW